MKTGRGEGENATQLSQREKNLNWPIEESWEADEGRRGRTQREKKHRVCGPGLSKGSCHIREVPLSTVEPL